MSAATTRAMMEGWQMYATGLQNLILAVLEFVDISPRATLLMVDDRERYFRELNLFFACSDPPGFSELGVARRLEEAAQNYLMRKFPMVSTAGFSMDEAIYGFRHSDSRLSLELEREARRAADYSILLFRGECTLELETFIKEMSQYGSFARPLPPTGVNDDLADASYRLRLEAINGLPGAPYSSDTVDAMVHALSVAYPPPMAIQTEVLIVVSQEKMDSAQSEAEAGLGALVSGEPDVAVVHFEIASNILRKAMERPKTQATEEKAPAKIYNHRPRTGEYDPFISS